MALPSNLCAKRLQNSKHLTSDKRRPPSWPNPSSAASQLAEAPQTSMPPSVQLHRFASSIQPPQTRIEQTHYGLPLPCLGSAACLKPLVDPWRCIEALALTLLVQQCHPRYQMWARTSAGVSSAVAHRCRHTAFALRGCSVSRSCLDFQGWAYSGQTHDL